MSDENESAKPHNPEEDKTIPFVPVGRPKRDPAFETRQTEEQAEQAPLEESESESENEAASAASAVPVEPAPSEQAAPIPPEPEPQVQDVSAESTPPSSPAALPPETINEDDEPVSTVNFADLIADDGPLSDDEDTLPPRPIMTTRAPEPEYDDTLDPDNQETPAVQRPAFNPLPPKAPKLEDDAPVAPRPQFNPAPRPPERDPDATTVNPAVAFSDTSRDPNDPATVEEIRRRRRMQAESGNQQQAASDAAQASAPIPQKPQPPTPVESISREPARKPPVRQAPARQSDPIPDRKLTRENIVKEPVRDPKTGRPEPLVISADNKKPPRTSCFGRFLILSFLALFLGAIFSVVGLAFGYVYIARDLPNASELKASDFETAIIYDRNGDVLYELIDPNMGDRTNVPLTRIDADLINATIATEDSRFYTNPGFDPIAITRAVIGAVRSRDLTAAGGASTITQQVVRALLLSDDERSQTTIRRKLREIILAAELGRTRSKDEILELYLNEIYYGNRAYGIEAAAQTYFDKPAADLTLAEASLLAGLPQAPALWDPVTRPDLAHGRQSEVLSLMIQHMGNTYTRDMGQEAFDQQIADTIQPPSVNLRYPHFTVQVLKELEEKYGPEIYRGGYRIYTTIDPNVQRLAEQAIADQSGNLAEYSANNAALVAIDPRTGQILALVGSRDYRDEAISGNVNMALTPRQPGSSIKPFVYLSAMELGYTPSTLFWDVPTAFPDGLNPDYTPKNYNNKFHGPMRLRTALGNSYNIPAVKALEFVGVCNFIARAQQLGLGLEDQGCIDQGTPRFTGLSLALGGSEVSPIEMASAFGALANQGRLLAPFSITRIATKDGTTEYQHALPEPLTTQVLSAEHAYLLTDILSDNSARQPEFEINNLLSIPGHRVAAKTGTSGTNAFDVRDGWTVGYAPDIVAAVWVGNTGNESMAESASGYSVASPVWNQFMGNFLNTPGRVAQDFVRPQAVINYDICADSGVFASQTCESVRSEIFNQAQPPFAASEHFRRNVNIDPWSLRIANEYCNDVAPITRTVFNLLASGRPDAKVRHLNEVENWLQSEGVWWANQNNVTVPLQANEQLLLNAGCEQNIPRPIARIDQPVNGEQVQGGFVQIGGQATATGFAGYQMQYGLGENPTEWVPMGEYQSSPQAGGQLASFNTDVIEANGPVTLRLVMYGPDNPYTPNPDRPNKTARTLINLNRPNPTATNTPTPVPTDEPTPTATPTEPPTATAVPATIAPLPTTAPTIAPIPTVVPTSAPTTVPTVVPIPPTAAPATAVPTVAPATAIPAADTPTPEPPTVAPPTAIPAADTPTPEPPTAVPPTVAPATDVPTVEPPTAVPPDTATPEATAYP